MINNMNVFDIAEGIKLHCIESPKFKTNVIGFYIRRPLSIEEASKNALISSILKRASNKYPSTQELNVELDDLYGTYLMADVGKFGDTQIIELALQFPNKKHIPEKNILNKQFELLKELIFNPLTKENGFNETIFKEEKELLGQEIEGRVNDKMHYSLEKCIETMCSEETYKIHKYGDLDSLSPIESEGLLEHYNQILKNSPIDIIVIGDIDSAEVKDAISEQFVFQREELVEFKREEIKKDITSVKYVKEEFDVQQGKLNLGFRTNIPYEADLYQASLLFSYVFGGGANSKLFKNVREKMSLCYYVFSRIEKFKSLMLVGSGIEVENYQKTLDLILEEFENVKKGDFTEEELKIAKLTVCKSLKSINDSQHGYMGFYFSQMLSSKIYDIDKLIEGINKVTHGEVVEAGKTFELDTVHFLTNKKEMK